MALHIKDERTDGAVRKLAKLKGQTLTLTIREAVERELERERARIPLTERLKPLQERFASLSRSGGRRANKRFFDELWGEE
jgi:antitoxin VapB